jgi:hypothetical protein
MRAIRIALVIHACAAFGAARATAQSFAGRWLFEEGGQQAVLELRQDAATGRVSGTLTVAGATSGIEGRVGGTVLTVDRMDGTAIPPGGLTATRDGDAVVLSIARDGADPVVWRMRGIGGVAQVGPAPPPVAPARGAGAGASAPAAAAGAGFRSAGSAEFAGAWQALSDDETSGELVELAANGSGVRGTLTAASRGFFSGEVKVERQLGIEGAWRDGTVDATLSNPENGQSIPVTLRLRGEFLVFLANGVEIGAYARPGRSLVANAEGSAAGAALARAIGGRVYSTSSQASGGGAFVGGRIRVAFCADQSISFDASDIAATPGSLPGAGVDMGTSMSRRGRWSIVLLAGAPAVRAEWQGTGTSYGLVDYIRVRPSADGRSAHVDGVELPATARC